MYEDQSPENKSLMSSQGGGLPKELKILDRQDSSEIEVQSTYSVKQRQRGTKRNRANHNSKRSSFFYPELAKIKPVKKEYSRAKDDFQKMCT